MKTKKHIIFPIIAVAVILLICYNLWANPSAGNIIIAESDNGIFDLQGFEFGRSNARLRGSVEYIPLALLSPEQFAMREGEAVTCCATVL
jgi:hypothetical protein